MDRVFIKGDRVYLITEHPLYDAKDFTFNVGWTVKETLGETAILQKKNEQCFAEFKWIKRENAA